MPELQARGQTIFEAISRFNKYRGGGGVITAEEKVILQHLIDLHSDRHHLTPKSRSATPNNKSVIKVSRVAHLAWHILFGNALPHEAKTLIDKYWTYNAVQHDIELPDGCEHYYKRD